MQERRVVNDAGLTGFFNKVYSTMGIGMLITAAVSYLLSNVFYNQYISLIVNNRIVWYLFLFLPLVLSFFVSSKRALANPAFGTLMFFLIAASFGFQIALFMSYYTPASVIIAFTMTAVMFFTMSLVGRFGKKDLSRAGQIAMGALLAVIILSVLNMFMGITGLSLIISYAILAIFIVLTAWDTQNLKNMYLSATGSGEAVVSEGALAVIGALTLYLDFLNMFLAVLQILGVSDRD